MELIKTEYYDYYKPKKLDINIKREIFQCNFISQLLKKKLITFAELMLSTKSINFDGHIIPLKINKKINYTLTKYIKQAKSIKNDLVVTHHKTNTFIVLKCDRYDYFKIDIKLFNKIKKQLIYKCDNIYEVLYILFLRYKSFGLLNGHLGSLPTEIYNKLIDNGVQLEMFASLFNHTTKHYCGLFVDLEYIFGCIGNFYSVNFKKGLYVANPPFDNPVINNLIDFFINKINKNCNIIVILPVFTIKFRKLLNKLCKQKLPTDYKTDVDTENLVNSKYCKYSALYCKNSFLYENFIKNKLINYTATHLLYLSDKSVTKIINIFNKPDYIVKKI